MDKTLEEKFDKAIDLLVSQFKPGTAPKVEDSMKLSQAILNMVNAKLGLEGKPKTPKS